MDYHAVCSMDCKISELTVGSPRAAAACNSRIAREVRDTSQNVSLHPLITTCSPLQELTQREEKQGVRKKDSILPVLADVAGVICDTYRQQNEKVCYNKAILSVLIKKISFDHNI